MTYSRPEMVGLPNFISDYFFNLRLLEFRAEGVGPGGLKQLNQDYLATY